MAAISSSTAAMTALMASDLTSGTGTRVGGVVGFSAVRICVPGMTGILRPPNADGNSGISKFPGSSGISKLPGNCISGNLKLPGKDGISGIAGILNSDIAGFSATATGVDFASISRFAADFFASKLGNADFLSEAAGGVGGGGGGGVAFLNPVPNPPNPDFLAAGGGGGGGGVGVLVAFLNPVPKPPNADFLAAGGGGGRGGVGVAFLIPVPKPKLGFFAGGGGGGGADSFFTPPNTVNGFFFTGSGSGAGVEASVFFAPTLTSVFFAGGGGGGGGGGDVKPPPPPKTAGPSAADAEADNAGPPGGAPAVEGAEGGPEAASLEPDDSEVRPAFASSPLSLRACPPSHSHGPNTIHAPLRTQGSMDPKDDLEVPFVHLFWEQVRERSP